jgi:poly-beta-1,6-N-acetyl-D-glucosamine synthase
VSTAIEIIVLILAGSYSFFLLTMYFGYAFRSRPQKVTIAAKKIAVVIAVRNEEKNIVALLNALDVQTHEESFDVVICDDHSEDGTGELIRNYSPRNFQLTLLLSPGAGKKPALTHAIDHVNAEIILVTDGDCIPGKEWVQSYVQLFSSNVCSFAAGMVQYADEKGLLRAILQTEMLFLQITSAGLYEWRRAAMCNGASMAFTKSFFIAENGFSGNAFVSGDDVFLLQKAMKADPEAVRWNYNHNAVVKTAAAASWNEAIAQRHRWISKFRGYGTGLLLAGLFFVLVQLLLPAAIVATVVYGSWINPFVYGFALKTAVELLFLSLTAPDFREHKIIPVFPLAVILYDVISLGAAFRAVRNEVTWKGRKWTQGKTV